MSVILDPPGTVLFAGVRFDDSDALERELRRGAAETVRLVETATAAADALDDGDLACLVVGRELTDGSATDLVASARSRDPDLPVVLVVDDPDAAFLASAVEAGVTDVVRAPASPSDVREAADDAVETYRRRRVEREESEILDCMLSDLGKSIYVKDGDARLVHMAEVPGGYDPEEARGKTDVELYGDDDPAAAREALEDDLTVIEEGTKVVDRDERVSGDDEELWMRTTKVPWTGPDGDVKGLIGHTVDVTEFKRAEHRLDALGRRFETFTSRLDHDVQTPLQVASGYLEVARETGDEESFEKVATALERIEEIVDDYGALNERAPSVDGLEPVELRETVRDVWSALDSGDADLVVDLEEDTRINATEEMVRPVLENLLKNAVTHAGDGATIRVGRTEGGFYVEDTGPGIPEPEREKVLETGYTTSSDGSGRGLSIVTEQMDKSVWSLDLSESPEGGARFEIGNCTFDAVGDPDGGLVDLDRRDAVGSLDQPAEATYDEEFDRWTLAADGTDVFRQRNDFYYVHAAVEGDVSVRGRVSTVERVDEYSKGGFMIRDDLDDGAAYGYVGKTPDHGTELLWRGDRGADGESTQLEEQAFTYEWYRLDREGDQLRMYLSLDGERWQEVGRRTVSLSDPVHVGLVACSTRPGQRTEAVFEDVRVRSE